MAPTENTYNIDPNHSIIVAKGYMTIGLIGPPTNEAVNININGKKYTAVAGDVLKFMPDPSTDCQLEIAVFRHVQGCSHRNLRKNKIPVDGYSQIRTFGREPST